jgi:hypothetical protein
MGDTREDPHPRVSPFTKLVIGFVVVVAAILLVLNLGGTDVPTEERGDITYIEGDTPRRQRTQEAQLVASIADLTSAQVTNEGDEIFFTAEVAASIPQPLRTSALEFRWDLTGDDGSSWTVSVMVEREAQAAVYTESGYGAGTIDDTLPGNVEVNDKGVTVRLRTAEIEDFPEAFEWTLASTLRAFKNEVDSPRVEDRFPDEGSIRYP